MREQYPDAGHLHYKHPDMQKKNLIRNFYRTKMRDLLKECLREGSVRSKIHLLAIDDEGEAVLAARPVPRVMCFEGQSLGRAWERLEGYKHHFIQSVSKDGYDVLAILHVEYEEDFSTGSEQLFCTMTLVKPQQKMFMRQYDINRIPAMVDEYGALTPSSISISLVD